MKFLLLTVLILVIVATPVLAEPGKNENKSSNGQGQNNSQSGNQGNQNNNQGNANSNPGSEKKDERIEEKAQASTSPAKKLNTATGSTATPSGKEQCDPNYPWKNHGEYVSCVAKLKPGGQSVSEAAKSDIGKKNQTGTPSASVSPTASGSAIPSISPSPEATSSGLVSSITENLESVQNTVNTIVDQFAALIELLNPFD